MSSSKFKVGDSLFVKEKGGLEKDNLDMVCSYSCSLCDNTYEKWNSYYKHMQRTHSAVVIQTVPTAPTRKKMKSPLPPSKQVMNEHKQSDGYPCDMCEKSYKYAFSLTRHVQKNHSAKQSSGKKRVQAAPRLALDLVNPTFKCDLCPQVFDSQERRNGHFETMHLPLIKKVFSKKGKKTPDVLPGFKCTICQKKFLFQKSLTVHIKTHSAKSSNQTSVVLNDQIYVVDGESVKPIPQKNDANPNLEKGMVIHPYPETHSLDYPDCVVDATDEVEDEFRMENFDEETNQHYICKASHNEDSDYMVANEATFPPEFVQSCMEILTSSSEKDFDHGDDCVLQRSPLFIFQKLNPVEQDLTRDTKTEDRKMIGDVIADIVENVYQAVQKHPVHQVSGGDKSDDHPVGVLDDKEDLGNEADCSNMDTSSDIVSDDFTSSPNQASSRTNKCSYSLGKSCTKKSPVLKEPSIKRRYPPKEFSSLKNPISSSSLVTSSPKPSPLITGVGDSPRGRLVPAKLLSSPPEAASYLPQYQSPSQQHQPSPHRGIHPILLPLYTQNPPPALSPSTRNVDNLISVFIHGRSGEKERGNF